MSCSNFAATTSAAPIRVGYVLKRFPRLTETFILNEILELERQGVDVHVFSLRKPRDEKRHDLLSRLNAKVTYLTGKSAASTFGVWEKASDDTLVEMRLAELRPAERQPFQALMPGRSRADAIALGADALTVALLAQARQISHLHAHFASDATTVALLASRISNIPFSFTAHARDIYHTYVSQADDDQTRREKMREAAFVVTVSEYNRRHLVSLSGPSKSAKILRLYNGIDLSLFSHSPEIRRRPGHVLAVGRLVEKKGFTHLIEACRLLKDAGTQFECDIVGEGPLEPNLRGQIEAAGLDDRVRLLGAMPQQAVLERMQESWVMALPCIVSESGDRDGLPTVLLEALAVGLPAISTAVAGIPEIIVDGESGLLVPPQDSRALAGALQRLLADANLHAMLSENGRERARAHFDLTTSVSQLRRLFNASAGASLEKQREELHADRLSVG